MTKDSIENRGNQEVVNCREDGEYGKEFCILVVQKNYNNIMMGKR